MFTPPLCVVINRIQFGCLLMRLYLKLTGQIFPGTARHASLKMQISAVDTQALRRAPLY